MQSSVQQASECQNVCCSRRSRSPLVLPNIVKCFTLALRLQGRGADKANRALRWRTSCLADLLHQPIEPVQIGMWCSSGIAPRATKRVICSGPLHSCINFLRQSITSSPEVCKLSSARDSHKASAVHRNSNSLHEGSWPQAIPCGAGWWELLHNLLVPHSQGAVCERLPCIPCFDRLR